MHSRSILDHPELGLLTRTVHRHGITGNWGRPLSFDHVPVNWRCTMVYVFDAKFAIMPEGYREMPNLSIEDVSGDGPSRAQVAAWQWYCANQMNVFSQAREALSSLIATQVEWERCNLITPGKEAFFEQEIARLGVLRPDGIDKQIQLSTLVLLERSKDDLAYSIFDFLWTWDEEHRASVLFHGTRLIHVFIEDGSFDLDEFISS